VALLDDVTRALRADSLELLARTLERHLQGQTTPLSDWDDLFVAITPVCGCAARLRGCQSVVTPPATKAVWSAPRWGVDSSLTECCRGAFQDGPLNHEE